MNWISLDIGVDAIGPETDFRIENTENQTMIRIKFRILLSRIEGGGLQTVVRGCI